MGCLVTLGILAMLAMIPLGISIRYNAAGPLVRVIGGPVRFTVYPASGKKKEKPSPKAEARVADTAAENLPKPPKPPKKQHVKQQGQEKGGSLTDFIPLVKLAFRFLGDFRKKLRMSRLELKLILGGGDPCDLAVNYGRTWAAVGNLLPKLETLFVIKKRDVEVECDFTASQTLVIARVELTVTLGRLLSLLTVYGVRALKEYLKLKKKRKGGAVA